MSSSGKRTLNRRDFLRGVSILGASSLLAACVPAAPGASPGAAPAEDTGAAPAAEGVTIQCWAFWNQLSKVEEKFRATEELQQALGNNSVEFRFGFERQVFLTAVAGGTPPDLGTQWGYIDFMSRGAAIPLDDYIAASAVISPDKFIEGNWETVQYQGKVYGIPSWECFVRRGLNYNARMVEEAGLDPDNPPVTWDEAWVWHEALTQFDDAGNLVQIGLDPYDAEGGVGPSGDGWFLADSWGFEWFNPDTKEFNLDNELMAEGMETMGEFVKLIGPDNLAGMRSVEGQGSWGGGYNAEVQAMIIEGYWHPGETFNEKPEVAEVNRTTWVPVPEARRGTKIQFGGGHMAQIFKDAKYQDEAWPLAEWLQTKAVHDIIFNDIGWLPAYKPYFEQADPNKFPGLAFYFDSIEEANYWGPNIKNEIENFVSQKFIELREAVYRDQMTGAEAAAKLQEEAVKEWKASGFGE
jgi:ABC-type glycerol-3-phosphate transport system substrate-binding protein